MSLLSFPTSFVHSNSFSFIPEPSSSYKPSQTLKFNRKRLSKTACVSGITRSSCYPFFFLSRHSGLSVVACSANDESGTGKEDSLALETVLKLYKALKDRDLDALSDVIGEECRFVCNFVSGSQPWEGKTQVLQLFSSLLGKMGNNIKFVVLPTVQDGMTVGVQWKLEWRGSPIPLGQGSSFFICHIYQGKVMIRNAEMFMEPMLHIEPLRLKIMAFMMNLLDKLSTQELSKGKSKLSVFTLLASFFMAALQFLLRLIYD